MLPYDHGCDDLEGQDKLKVLQAAALWSAYQVILHMQPGYSWVGCHIINTAAVPVCTVLTPTADPSGVSLQVSCNPLSRLWHQSDFAIHDEDGLDA